MSTTKIARRVLHRPSNVDLDATQSETPTGSTLTTTRATKSSATESDTAEFDVTNSGTGTGSRGRALMGAVVGAIFFMLAY